MEEDKEFTPWELPKHPPTEVCFVANNLKHSVRIGMSSNKDFECEGLIFTRHCGEKDFEYMQPTGTLTNTVKAIHRLHHLRGGERIVVPDFTRYRVTKNLDGNLIFAKPKFNKCNPKSPPPKEVCFVDRKYSLRIGRPKKKEINFIGLIFTRHSEMSDPKQENFEYLHPLYTLEATVLALHYLNYIRGGEPIDVSDMYL